MQGILEWLQPFTDNLEDLETHVPAHSSERENSDSEDATIVVTQKRKHSIYIHFPKDRNCDVCLRTKITRVPCRRRNEGSIPRAENFGDLMTADHKLLNEGSESRNNHRYAVVVQDLTTQWIQSYPRKTKTSQETEKSLRMFLEPSQKPNVIYTDNSLEFGESCEELSWKSSNMHTSSVRDKRKCRTICTQSKRRNIRSIVTIGLGRKIVGRFYGMLLLSAKCPRPPGRRENSVSRTNHSIRCTGGISPNLRERQSENSSIRKESITRNLPRICTKLLTIVHLSTAQDDGLEFWQTASNAIITY